MSLGIEVFETDFFRESGLLYVSVEELESNENNSSYYNDNNTVVYSYVIETTPLEIWVDQDVEKDIHIVNIEGDKKIPLRYKCDEDFHELVLYSLSSPINLFGNFTTDCSLSLTLISEIAVNANNVTFSGFNKVQLVAGTVDVGRYFYSINGDGLNRHMHIGSLNATSDLSIYAGSIEFTDRINIEDSLSLNSSSTLHVLQEGNVLVRNVAEIEMKSLKNYGVLRFASPVTFFTLESFENYNSIVSTSFFKVSATSFTNQRYFYSNSDVELYLHTYFTNQEDSSFTAGSLRILGLDSEKVNLFTNRGMIETTNSSLEISANEINLLPSSYGTKKIELQKFSFSVRSNPYLYFCFSYQTLLTNDPKMSSTVSMGDILIDSSHLFVKYSIIHSAKDIYLSGKLETKSITLSKESSCIRFLHPGHQDDPFDGIALEEMSTLNHLFSNPNHKGIFNLARYSKPGTVGDNPHEVRSYLNSILYEGKPILSSVTMQNQYSVTYQTLSPRIHAAGSITGNIDDISTVTVGFDITSELSELLHGNNYKSIVAGKGYIQEMKESLSVDKRPEENMPLLIDKEGSNTLSFSDIFTKVFTQTQKNMFDYQTMNFGSADTKNSLIQFKKELYLEGSNIHKKYNSFDMIRYSVPTLGDYIFYDSLFKSSVYTYIGLLRGVSPIDVFETLRTNCETTSRLIGFSLPIENITPNLLDSLIEPMICPVLTHDCLDLAPQCVDYQILFNDKVIREFISQDLISAEDSIDLTVTGNAFIKDIRAGKEIKLTVEGSTYTLGSIEANNINVVNNQNFINLGTINSIEDIFIKALNIAVSGTIKSGNDLSLESLNNLIIATLVAVSRCSAGHTHISHSEIISAAKIEAGSQFYSNSSKDSLIAGTEIIGESVYINSGGKLHIVPVKIYNELTQWGKRFYYSHKTLELHRSTITSSSGNTLLESKDGMYLSGVLSNSSESINVVSSTGSLKVDNPSFWESLEVIVKKKGFLGTSIGARSSAEKSFESNLIGSSYHAAEYFLGSSKEDQTWEGIKIFAKSVELRAGSPEHAAKISLLAGYERTEYVLITESSKLSFNFKGGKFSWAEITESGRGKGSVRVFPTVIQVEDQFYVHSVDQFYAVSPSITKSGSDSASQIIIDARDIKIDSAPDVDFEFAYMRKGTTGVGFKAGFDEVSVSAYVDYKHSSTAKQHINPKEGEMTADFISLKADRIEDCNILYTTQRMEEEASFIFHNVAKELIIESSDSKTFEVGFKIGVRSNLGAIKRNVENISKLDTSSESVISTAFEVWSMYNNILTMLSESTNNGISGGVWFYIEGQVTSYNSIYQSPKPVIYNVSEYSSISEELHLVSTQYKAYEAYIESKYLDVRAEKRSFSSKTTSQSASGDIPILGNIIPTIGIGAKESDIIQEQHFTSNIFVTDRLVLNIQGKANLHGAVIEAGSLEASFNELLIESLIDVNKQVSKGANIGFSADKLGESAYISQIGAEIRKGKSHAVGTLTRMLGSTEANIVVANALRMNGAMIACAQRGDDGEYTDHGNLTLEVGKLFVEHISIYDKGYSLSGSVGMGGKLFFKDEAGKKKHYMTLNGAVGAHSYEGLVYGTIGKGNITVAEESELERANRDVGHNQQLEKDYDVDPIKLYFTNREKSQLQMPSSFDEFTANAKDSAYVETKLDKVADSVPQFAQSLMPRNWYEGAEVEVEEGKNTEEATLLEDLVVKASYLLDKTDSTDQESESYDETEGDLVDQSESGKGIVGEKLQELGEWLENIQDTIQQYLPTAEDIECAQALDRGIKPGEELEDYISESRIEHQKGQELLQPAIDPIIETLDSALSIAESIKKALWLTMSYPGYDQDGITDLDVLSKIYDTPIFKTPEQKKALNFINAVLSIGMFGGKFVFDKIKYGEFLGGRHIIEGKLANKYKTPIFNDKLKTKDFVGLAFEKAPYGYKPYVLEYYTTSSVRDEFVRLINTDSAKGLISKPDGAFIMLKRDFIRDIKDGLTIADISDKYGLPNIPNKIVFPEIPSKVRMGVGMAGEIEFNMENGIMKKTGGGIQYQILEEPDQKWFPESSIKDINKYIKQYNK